MWAGDFLEKDSIADFGIGDKIDLSTLDANSTVAGNQAFSFIGNSGFTGISGQLKMGNIYYPAIYGDINGDSQPDFQIQMTALGPLTQTDFIL